MRPEVVADLGAKPYARESHSRGLSLSSFEASCLLRDEYEVLSLSTDPEGEVRNALLSSQDLNSSQISDRAGQVLLIFEKGHEVFLYVCWLLHVGQVTASC